MFIFTHAHNCGTDVARGICKQDVYGNRTWVEQEVAAMWTNVVGPIPGGNLMMPPARPDGSPWTEVILSWISGFFALRGRRPLPTNAYMCPRENEGKAAFAYERVHVSPGKCD